MSERLPGQRESAIATRGPGNGKRIWRGKVASAATQRELKEEVILECAASWFHRHGFHGASLSDVAGELGITKAALYHYAKNKEELLYKLHVRSLQAAKAARDQAVDAGSNGLDRLYRLVYNVVMVMTGPVTQTFVLLEPGTLNAAHTREIAQARLWLTQDLRALIAQGIEDGSIAACDPKLAAFVIVGAQNWIGRWYRPQGEWSRERIARQHADMMRKMLGKPGARRQKKSEPGSDRLTRRAGPASAA